MSILLKDGIPYLNPMKVNERDGDNQDCKQIVMNINMALWQKMIRLLREANLKPHLASVKYWVWGECKLPRLVSFIVIYIVALYIHYFVSLRFLEWLNLIDNYLWATFPFLNHYTREKKLFRVVISCVQYHKCIIFIFFLCFSVCFKRVKYFLTINKNVLLFSLYDDRQLSS